MVILWPWAAIFIYCTSAGYWLYSSRPVLQRYPLITWTRSSHERPSPCQRATCGYLIPSVVPQLDQFRYNAPASVPFYFVGSPGASHIVVMLCILMGRD